MAPTQEYTLPVKERIAQVALGLFVALICISHFTYEAFALPATPPDGSGPVLLKNDGELLPIVGQPRIALLRLGKSDPSPIIEGLDRHFTKLDPYLFGDLYSLENRTLVKSLGLYDLLLVAVTPGGEDEAFEIEKLLKKQPGVLILIGDVTFTKELEHAVSFAQALVLSPGTGPQSLALLSSLLSGEKSFGATLTHKLTRLYPAGSGLKTKKTRLGYATPEEMGLDGKTLEKIDRIVEEGLRAGAYPGAQVLVVKGGNVVYEKAFGHKDAAKKEPNNLSTLYDLASVTKATATNALLMMAVSEGLLSPNDKASKYLPYLRDCNKENLRLRQFLFHNAGMPAVIRFYKEILIDPNSYDEPLFRRGRAQGYPVQISARDYARKDWQYKKRLVRNDSSALFPIRMARGLYLSPEVRPQMREKIRNANLRQGYRYSDIDFLILQDVVESVFGMEMDKLFRKKFAEPLGLERLLYCPLRRYSPREIAEGTRELFLRKQTLRGDVDDEAAAMLGGVSGNAGLYGNAGDLAVLLSVYLNRGSYGGLRYMDAEVVRDFTSARSSVGPYAMGFDRPRGKGRPGNTADEAPLSTYGHTGFTGTCFWIDPDNDLIYIFLSNRGAPTRWNTTLSRLNIRTRIQSVIYEALKK